MRQSEREDDNYHSHHHCLDNIYVTTITNERREAGIKRNNNSK